MSQIASKAVALVVMMEMLQWRPYTAAELAQRLGVSHRTVNRYLLDLQGELIRYPLVTCDDDRYAHMEIATGKR